MSPGNSAFGLPNHIHAKNVYALVIGINEYPNNPKDGWSSLNGAVPDAEHFYKFLTGLDAPQPLAAGEKPAPGAPGKDRSSPTGSGGRHFVPSKNVQFMRNSTRQEIIDAYTQLIVGKLFVDSKPSRHVIKISSGATPRKIVEEMKTFGKNHKEFSVLVDRINNLLIPDKVGGRLHAALSTIRSKIPGLFSKDIISDEALTALRGKKLLDNTKAPSQPTDEGRVFSARVIFDTQERIAEAQERITKVIFESATRTLVQLPKPDEDGQPQCAFTFFYAGHGGRSKIPNEWKKSKYSTPDGYLEVIIPSDVCDSPKAKVPGIADRVTSSVLKRLCAQIGGNVVSVPSIRVWSSADPSKTTILDCCHSFGQTRAQQAREAGIVARRMENLPSLDGFPDDALVSADEIVSSLSRGPRGGTREDKTDVNIAGGRGRGSRSPRSADQPATDATGSVTQILLAACQQDQIAGESISPNEKVPRGIFTSALLRILTAESPRLFDQRLTYAGLLLRMQMETNRGLQIPACYGADQDRVLFTTMYGKSTKDLYVCQTFRVETKNESGIVTSTRYEKLAYGGLVHGFCEGDTLDLFKLDGDLTPYGRAKVKKCHAVCASIVPVDPLAPTSTTQSVGETRTLHETFYCKLVESYDKEGKLYLDVKSATGSELAKDIESVFGAPAPRREDASIVISEEDSGHFVLSFTADDAYFQLDEPNLEVRHKINKEDVKAVVKKMFQFKKLLTSNLCGNQTAWRRKPGRAKQRAVAVAFCEMSQMPAETEGRIEPAPSHVPAQELNTLADSDAKTIGAGQAGERELRVTLLARCVPYGFAITNNTDLPLFVYVLRFEIGELSIVPIYSSTYFTPDVPLYEVTDTRIEFAGAMPGDKPLCIGTQSSGVDPLIFIKVLPRKVPKQRVFFKIIATLAPTDLSMFTSTPWDPAQSEGPGSQRATTSRGLTREESHADALAMAFKFMQGDYSQEYVSRIFCLDLGPEAD